MESWSELLGRALDTPGARYARLTDPASGSVVAARGTPAPDAGPAAAVTGWAAAEEASGHPLDDAVITTDTAYHLVRTLPGDRAPLLVYLCVDRTHGNLALARRTLVSLRRYPLPPGNTSGSEVSGGPLVPAQAPAPAIERTPSAIPLPRRGSGATTPSAPPVRVPVPVVTPSPSPRVDRAGPAPSPVPAAGAAPADRNRPTDPALHPRNPVEPPGGRWADDLRTMARILAGLRRMDRSHPTDG
ncbi:hypothetical protein [Pseudonocardia sp. HH130630-07]|uniref:hypothetical protein n=1 Tax=Pseudonocardia sp. HH130630-07 TaxID=1690815 RepID=UPI0008151A79|nr:hypothetical protein [Pseudonocardia sp. HH130630-07]ANY06692.1 hypothetical protein AFB00_10735 [Pseudonocardia sp. HH130630-07]